MATLAIGEQYLARYKALFYPSQLLYCRLHNYELKICDEFLEPGQTSATLISLQRLLVPKQKWCEGFDYVIFVDADILINVRTAPPIHSAVDYGDCIGVVDEYSQPTRAERLLIQKRNNWETTASEYYALAGFEIDTDIVFNTAVLVFQPAKHADFLERMYAIGRDTAKTHPRKFHYDQSLLGWHLQKEEKAKVMDNRFNALYSMRILSEHPDKELRTFYNENFFIHFAGMTDHGRETEISNLSAIRRDEPCPCGSEKSFEHCHWAALPEEIRSRS
jgi:lipopolysaccharide biosynthesis glycosyltransferase